MKFLSTIAIFAALCFSAFAEGEPTATAKNSTTTPNLRRKLALYVDPVVDGKFVDNCLYYSRDCNDVSD